MEQEAEAFATIVTAILEALPDPVIAIGEDGRILAVNRNAQRLFPALKVGNPLALSLRAPDLLDCVQKVTREGGSDHVTLLERVPLERLFDVHVARIDLPVHYLLLSLRDLTEARRVERMRVDFIANASHELRTPLASLLGFVETLQGAARDDVKARQRFLNIMHEQAQRMARLVDDLLSLSRIEQNLHIRPQTKLDLVLVARHVADTLSRLAKESHTHLALSMPARAIVLGERDELVRLIENLIENAIKYAAGEEGQIKAIDVTIETLPKQICLTIRDYGPGIAPEHLPRLTERFYRVDAGKSRSKGGTGLGLAIVKHIVARHRGILNIESEIGEGTSFFISIPNADKVNKNI